MRSEDLAIIRQLPLFANMSGPHFASLMKAALFQRFPEQIVLIEEGEKPDFLHVIVEGEVELYAHYRGRKSTIEILYPVTTFILAAVIQDEVHLQSARTLSFARILLIPASSIREMLARDSGFAQSMIHELASRYRSAIRALKNEKLRSASERIANWIVRTSKAQNGSRTVEITYDKRILASYLGMTPESLSRALVQLSEHGIRVHGRRIEIINQEALIRIAKPDNLIDT